MVRTKDNNTHRAYYKYDGYKIKGSLFLSYQPKKQ